MTALDVFADLPRWVYWRNEARRPNGDLTKIPYGARGRKAKANDPLTWILRSDAEKRLPGLLNGDGGSGGVGIELGDLGDGRHLGGLDLDSCLDENGTLAPWADPLLAEIDTYAEFSPSGRGIKALFTIAATHARPFLDLIGVEADKWGTKRGIDGLNGANHGPGIEIYLSHRFFAITERLFPGKPDRIGDLDQPALKRLAKLIPLNKPPGKKTSGADPTRSAKAFRAGLELRRQGKTFDEMCEALRNHADPDIAAWCRAKGDERQLRRIWDKAAPPDPDVVDNLRATLTYLNNRYFVLSEAGKVWVGEWRVDSTFNTRREVLDRFSFAAFRELYLNRSVKTAAVDKDGNNQSMNVAEYWLRHPRRRQYDGVVFDPSGVPDGTLNLWRGFGVTPTPGDWSLMRKHILIVICRGDPIVGEYFLNWMARMVQYPQEPGEVALVIRSDEEGTGKGILGRYLCQMLGHHGLHITHATHLTGRFNDHLQDCVFLFADEAFFAGDKAHGDILKGLITEYMLTTEGKYRPVVSSRNRLHILIVSNHDLAVATSIRARRFVITESLDTHLGERSYFTAIIKQMDNGGLAAMLHDLMTRDISDFDARVIPETEALREQKTLSLPSLDRWWVAVLLRGYLWRSHHGAPWFNAWHEFYTTELLMNSYLQWCEANRPFDRKNLVQLGAFFTKIYSRARPSGDHPVHEVQSIERGRTQLVTLPDNTTRVVSLSLDELAIALKDRPMGYQVGQIEEARARYSDMRKDINPPWGDSAYAE